MVHNMKKIHYFLLMIILLTLTGCGYDTLEVVDKKTEEEVIKYVEDKIYSETFVKVNAKIDTIRVQTECAYTFDTCVHYANVEGGNEYILTVTAVDNEEIVGSAIYSDAYKKSKSDYVYKERYYSGFNYSIALYEMKKQYESIIDKYTNNYHLEKYPEYRYGLNIFIHETDSNKIKNMIEELNDITDENKYKVLLVSYGLYVYKDKDAYDTLDINKYIQAKEYFKSDDLYEVDYGEPLLKFLSDEIIIELATSDGFSDEVFNTNNDDYRHEVYFYYMSPSESKNGKSKLFAY